MWIVCIVICLSNRDYKFAFKLQVYNTNDELSNSHSDTSRMYTSEQNCKPIELLDHTIFQCEFDNLNLLQYDKELEQRNLLW